MLKAKKTINEANQKSEFVFSQFKKEHEIKKPKKKENMPIPKMRKSK